MLEASVLVLLIAFPVLGAVTRQWLATLVPLLGWPLFYAGMDRGWWLYGTGDGWQAAAIFLTVSGFVTTLVVVAAARAIKPPSRDWHFG